MRMVNTFPLSEEAEQKIRFPQANNQYKEVGYSGGKEAMASFVDRNQDQLNKLADMLNHPQE